MVGVYLNLSSREWEKGSVGGYRESAYSAGGMSGYLIPNPHVSQDRLTAELRFFVLKMQRKQLHERAYYLSDELHTSSKPRVGG